MCRSVDTTPTRRDPLPAVWGGTSAPGASPSASGFLARQSTERRGDLLDLGAVAFRTADLPRVLVFGNGHHLLEPVSTVLAPILVPRHDVPLHNPKSTRILLCAIRARKTPRARRAVSTAPRRPAGPIRKVAWTSRNSTPPREGGLSRLTLFYTHGQMASSTGGICHARSVRQAPLRQVLPAARCGA